MRNQSVPGWTAWPRGCGTGLSMTETADGVRGDMAPVRNEDTRLIEWGAILWRGSDRDDVVAEVRAPDMWRLARECAAVLEGAT